MLPMRTEGEHADTLWLETACSPLPRTQAYVCPIAEATLCYRTCPHSAILISTNEAYAGGRVVAPWRPHVCPRPLCGHPAILRRLDATTTTRETPFVVTPVPPSCCRTPYAVGALGMSKEAPTREVLLYLLEKSLVPTGEVPCTYWRSPLYLLEKSLVPTGEKIWPK